jgi:protein-L-isoaspartate(D-aspartate) O-methyltransferase
LLDQLAAGGRMMIPVGTFEQYIYIFDKNEKGEISSEAVLPVNYVPLTSIDKQLEML